MGNALILENLTWRELEEVRHRIELVVMPLGSTEQHGPNTTPATDTVRAREMGRLIGEEFGSRILVGPAGDP